MPSRTAAAAALPEVPSALTSRRRAADLARLADGWRPDLLVVGAGFTGCGIALDAALRGLSVAVVDRGDLASGTSRWSSKLVHGGLRYLATGDVALARESAIERGLLMQRIAPHLARPLRFLTPACDGVPLGVVALAGVGYLAGDALRIAARTSSRTLSRPRVVGPAGAAALVPAVRRAGLRGGLVNVDGQLVDDARAVVALARTAAAHGAAVCTRVRADAVEADAAVLTDLAGGGSFTARAGRVVVAAGAWSDSLDDRVRLRPSKGVHLVVDGAALGHPTAALAAPIPGHVSRFALVLPQHDGRVLIGLTDDEVEGPVPDEAPVLAEEQAFLLDAVNRVLERPLAPADVLGGFAGFRPLVAGADGVDVASSDLSRAHLVLDDPDGPITIVGGKLTTYRRMAADVVDRVTDRPCTTAGQPLVGAVPRARIGEVAARPWLAERYGGEAPQLESLIAAEPTLGAPVLEGRPHLQVELAWAVLREGAVDAADLLDRRTRIGWVAGERAAALPVAERLLEAHAGQG